VAVTVRRNYHLDVTATGIDWPTSPGTPITINSGGTYSGYYKSTDSGTPAVLIATTAPVLLDHALIEHVGVGIETTFNHLANLTVRDCKIEQLDPGAGNGERAIYSWRAQTLIVEYCDLVDGNGIRWDGGATTVDVGQIRYNRCFNIGRYGTGELVQFLQLNQATFPDGCEVAWNHVENTPFLTEVEDVINCFGTSGASGTPVDIHHNLIDGGFRPPTTGAYGHTGTGTVVGDGVATGGSFFHVHHNTYVRCLNGGPTAAGGDSVEIDNNVVVYSGLIDGVPSGPDFGNGLVFWDYPVTSGTPTNGSVHDNVVGYNRLVGGDLERSDYFTPECGLHGNVCSNNTSMAEPVTVEDEDAACADWEAARITAGVTIGPRP